MTPWPVLAQKIIDDQRQEIDFLNEQIAYLQQDLAEKYLKRDGSEVQKLVGTVSK